MRSCPGAGVGGAWSSDAVPQLLAQGQALGWPRWRVPTFILLPPATAGQERESLGLPHCGQPGHTVQRQSSCGRSGLSRPVSQAQLGWEAG